MLLVIKEKCRRFINKLISFYVWLPSKQPAKMVCETMSSRRLFGVKLGLFRLYGVVVVQVNQHDMPFPPGRRGVGGGGSVSGSRAKLSFFLRGPLLLGQSDQNLIFSFKLIKLFFQVVHIYEWYMRCYPEDISDKTNLYTAIQTNAAYQGLKHPVKKTDDGKFLPDFTYRYMTEDIPYGLVVIRGIAEIVGVKTPNIDKILTWSQEKMGKEYLVNSKLQGKDVFTSRAPQRYGFTTLESIL